MIHLETGAITDNFYVLGTSGVPSYLYDCERPALFDAGLTCLGGMYVRDIEKILCGRAPEFLFLTHAHFDHVGAVSTIKRRFPKIRIGASLASAKILKKTGAIGLITSLNEAAKSTILVEAGKHGKSHEVLDIPFEPFEIDIVLSDGDSVELGDGIRVVAMETPGHTRDFLTYYIPERRILIPSEGVGCTDPSGFVYTEFLVSFADYLASMKRLGALEVDVLCQGHYSVLSGSDATRFFEKSFQKAGEYKDMVEGFLETEDGDVSRVVGLVKKAEWDPKPEPKQPEVAYVINTQARVLHIKKLAAPDE